MNRTNLRLFYFLSLTLFPGTLSAVVHEGEVAGVRYRVMAPDWIPRGEIFSVLIVLNADSPITVAANLTPPRGGFGSAGDIPLAESKTVQVVPGEVLRFAFTDWLAVPDEETGEFEFQLTLKPTSELLQIESVETLTLPVKTIRGSVVSRSMWSIVVPVAMSLLALPLFVLLLRRYSRPRAWRDAIDAQIPSSEEAWWADRT